LERIIDFYADIVSGRSVGGVVLMDDIADYLGEMYANHQVVSKSYRLPDGQERLAYSLDDTLTVVALPSGSIFSIGCNGKYRGRCNERFYPGQTMGDVARVTARQRIFNGCLVVDDDFGFSFMLPSPYDEVADSVGDLPLDLVLEELYVSDFSAWNPDRQV